jgi:5-methylcytosine-specific restriction endonuclease McrA
MGRELSSMAQVALWLARTVGEGTVFTKHSLRAEFPQFEQADRRMRDLRQHGWRIDTNREDATLRPSELRLVTVGVEVWDPSFRPGSETRIGPKAKALAISSAGFQCEYCGAQIGDKADAVNKLVRLRVVSTTAGTVVTCEDCAGGVATANEARLKKLSSLLRECTHEELSEFRRRSGQGNYQQRVEAALVLASRLPPAAVNGALPDSLFD